MVRRLLLLWLLLAAGFASLPVVAADVAAGAPTDLSVTVYRAPERRSGSLDLDRLGGFALVSETRTVHVPAGESRLRFEGVADGIEADSAIVAGLPALVIEKNREGQLLSPAALVAATVGKPVVLERTNTRTGETERLPGTIKSDVDGGVVFDTALGIEALRCSGLPETFSFAPVTGLSATPTLSVRVRSSRRMTAVVTLSYLARGFDWAADYVATLSADGTGMDLGAWVTLANGNGESFAAAHTQVVAGRLNRERGVVEPIDAGGPILARCWPRGSTSDSPAAVHIRRAIPLGFEPLYLRFDTRMQMQTLAAPAAARVMVTARQVEQEQLGDLKLYRVPDRTTVAGRQSKQVRLLDRSAIPVQAVYGVDLAANDAAVSVRAQVLLRTTNDAAHHLGLPLPSGRIAVFAADGAARVLLHESGMRDLAVAEEVEIDMGAAPDVQVRGVREETSIDTAHARLLPLVPGVSPVRSARTEDTERVEISNARAASITFELRLRLEAGAQVIRADHPLGSKNGRPLFRLTVPAHATATVRYQIRQGA